jgi:cytidylate kinase
MIIAIDGPVAAGKGTIARALAERFGFAHLDTGLLYRAVGVEMVKAGLDLSDADAAGRLAAGLDASQIDEHEARTSRAGRAAAVVAAHPPVRAALLQLQREFAHRPGGAVLDGRDIATVICPDADVKIYVTASDEARAKRRHAEFEHRGEAISLDDVLAQLRERDARDQGRTDAPLMQADDAVLLDTSELSIEAAISAAAVLVMRARGG